MKYRLVQEIMPIISYYETNYSIGENVFGINEDMNYRYI